MLADLGSSPFSKIIIYVLPVVLEPDDARIYKIKDFKDKISGFINSISNKLNKFQGPDQKHEHKKRQREGKVKEM